MIARVVTMSSKGMIFALYNIDYEQDLLANSIRRLDKAQSDKFEAPYAHLSWCSSSLVSINGYDMAPFIQIDPKTASAFLTVHQALKNPADGGVSVTTKPVED